MYNVRVLEVKVKQGENRMTSDNLTHDYDKQTRAYDQISKFKVMRDEMAMVLSSVSTPRTSTQLPEDYKYKYKYK